MPRAKARPARPPRGLVAEHIEVEGEELMVFSWDDRAESAEPPETLSAAERDVLLRIVRGDTNAAIAKARQTAVRTVANQVASLLKKTGAASRYELIQRYAGSGRG